MDELFFSSSSPPWEYKLELIINDVCLNRLNVMNQCHSEVSVSYISIGRLSPSAVDLPPKLMKKFPQKIETCLI